MPSPSSILPVLLKRAVHGLSSRAALHRIALTTGREEPGTMGR